MFEKIKKTQEKSLVSFLQQSRHFLEQPYIKRENDKQAPLYFTLLVYIFDDSHFFSKSVAIIDKS